MPKPTPDQAFTDVQQALALIKSASSALPDLIRAHELSVDARIKANTELVEKHLNNPDMRPVFKITSKGTTHTVMLNDQLYTFGFNALSLNDTDAYYWTEPSGKDHSATNNFQCLISVLLHYCNQPKEPANDPTV